MASENLYNKALEKLMNRIETVSDRIAKNFKGVPPFDKQKIPTINLLTAYDNLTTEDMNYLVQRHGRDTVNEFIGNMENEKVKRLNR